MNRAIWLVSGGKENQVITLGIGRYDEPKKQKESPKKGK